MARVRSGKTTWVVVIKKACQVSKLSGFRAAVIAAIGATDGVPLLEAWDVFCALFDATLAADDWPWQIDRTFPTEPEDIAPS